MTKAIRLTLSDHEYREVSLLVGKGFARSKADFVRKATQDAIRNHVVHRDLEDDEHV